MLTRKKRKPVINISSPTSTDEQIDDQLPPAEKFSPVGVSGWCSHPGAPDWLLKQAERVYCHVPTSTLWRRTHKAMVRIDAYRDALTGFAVRSPELLVRSSFAAWKRVAQENQKWNDAGTDLCEEDAPSLNVRKAAKGLRHSRQGVSPPPEKGWSPASRGWQRHTESPKWLRKETELDGPVFFYMPKESLWMVMPNGAFACVDVYHSAVAAFAVATQKGLLRSCLLSWQGQAHTVRLWRQKIRVLTPGYTYGNLEEAVSKNFEEEQKQSDSEDGDGESTFPVRTAFMTMSARARRSNSWVSRKPVRSETRASQAKVSFLNSVAA